MVEEKRFVDAISTTLSQVFREDEAVLLMGQDVAEYGVYLKLPMDSYPNSDRNVFEIPPSQESGVLGTALGLSLEGFKPIVEMQFADFVSCGMNQIIQNIAKSHYQVDPWDKCNHSATTWCRC